MIIKLTNKDKDFYNYMGKFFGSRVVERETTDRIYDDDDKEWYIYLEKEEVVGYISIAKSTIKNVYSIKDEYLTKLLEKAKKEIAIGTSKITKRYSDAYTAARISNTRTRRL